MFLLSLSGWLLPWWRNGLIFIATSLHVSLHWWCTRSAVMTRRLVMMIGGGSGGTAWVDFCLMDVILLHSMTWCNSSRNLSMDLFSWTAGNKCFIFVERGKCSLMNTNSLTTPARSWWVVLSRNLPSTVHVHSLMTCANYNYVLRQNRNFRSDNWKFHTELTSNSALMHWCDKIPHWLNWKFHTDALVEWIPHWDRPKFRTVNLNSAFYFVTVAASYILLKKKHQVTTMNTITNLHPMIWTHHNQVTVIQEVMILKVTPQSHKVHPNALLDLL